MYKGFNLQLDSVQEIDDSPFTKEEIPEDYHRKFADSFISEFLKDENAVKR